MASTTASQARANLYQLLDRASEDPEIVTISYKGKTVYLVGEDEMDSLKEMIHLLGSRENGRRLYDSLDAVDRGDLVQMDADEALDLVNRAVAAIDNQEPRSA